MTEHEREQVKVAITQLLLKAEPGLLKGDSDAAVRASHILCDVLGAVLATPVVVASRADPDLFTDVVHELVKRITSAALTTAKAQISLWPAKNALN